MKRNDHFLFCNTLYVGNVTNLSKTKKFHTRMSSCDSLTIDGYLIDVNVNSSCLYMFNRINQ